MDLPKFRLSKSKTYQCLLSLQMSHAISMLLQPYDVQKLEEKNIKIKRASILINNLCVP
jgi:hypothetical protein